MRRIEKIGFTLIELLIATAIFSIVILGVYAVFQSGIFSYRKIDSAFELYQSARIIFKRIELDLKNSFSYCEDNPNFSGSSEALEFFSVIDFFEKGDTFSNICRIKYELDQGRLRRLCYWNLDAIGENSVFEVRELAYNIEALSFQYVKNNPDEEYKWQDSWSGLGGTDQENGLPLAVKIELSLFEKDNSQEKPATIKFTKVVSLPLSEESFPVFGSGGINP